MIVADTNLVVSLFVQETQTPLARAVFARDADWRMPAFWKAEFLNVLSTYVRFGDMPLEDSLRLWRLATEASFIREEAVDGAEALRLAKQHKISGYDAVFLALARRLDVALVTADKKLCKTAPGLAVPLETFASMKE